MTELVTTKSKSKTVTSPVFRKLTRGTRIVETTHGVRVFSAEVGPEIAAEILGAGNEKNRKIRPTKLAQYREEMNRGRWRLQNTLLVTKMARLIDGQHRLTAVVETGIPQTLLFQIIPEEEETAADLATDTGAIRTLADTLHHRGVAHSSRVAAFLVHERSFRLQQDPSSSVQSTKTSYLKLLREIGQKKITDAIGIVPRGMAAKLGLKQSIIDWCAFHFAHADDTHAQLFMQAVMDGDASDDKSILVLREELIRLNGAKKTRGTRTSGTDYFHMLVKGWNAYFDSQPVKPRALHSKAREEFPSVRGGE